jgi:tryptophan-rich sensory protein
MRPLGRGAALAISALAVAVAGAAGASNGPQRPSTAVWYAALRKPAATPPGPAIGAAWGVLELLLVASGYRLLRAPDAGMRRVALGGWALTLAGLAGYPYLFFGRRGLASSAVASGGMLAAAATTALAAREVDDTAAGLTVPLVLWLTFATGLSEELWRRNERPSRG